MDESLRDEGGSSSNPSRAAVLQYLQSSFVYDLKAGQDFLKRTLLSIDAGDFARQADRATASVLEECVAGAVQQSGGGRLLLPLTGGLDSRSILAAYLSNHRRDSVTCCTVGENNDRDVVVAQRVCDSLGIDWVHLQRVEYDPELFSSSAASIHAATGSYIGIGSWSMRIPIVALASESDAMVLTGWGQQTIKEQPGPNLHGEKYISEVARLFRKNSLGSPRPEDGIHEALSETASWVQSRLPSDCQISLFELLRIAFPSNLRVQANVQAMFSRSAPVFARPLWMAHWYGRRLDERIFKKQWAEELHRRYPHVFPHETMQKRGPTATRIEKAQSRLRRLRLAPTQSDRSRDSVIDESIELVQETVTDLAIPLNLRSSTETTGGIDKVLSLAGHLRAGTLTPRDTET